MPTRLLFAAPALAGALAIAGAAQAQAGATIYEQRCAMCHANAVGVVPNRLALAKRPQAEIVQALTVGVMKPQASGLTPAEIKAVAAYLAPAKTTAAVKPAPAKPTPAKAPAKKKT